MDRRTAIGGAACSVIAASAFSAKGQRRPLPVIGVLSSRSPEESETHAAAFRCGLSDSGGAARRGSQMVTVCSRARDESCLVSAATTAW